MGHIREMKGREFDPYELNGGLVRLSVLIE